MRLFSQRVTSTGWVAFAFAAMVAPAQAAPQDAGHRAATGAVATPATSFAAEAAAASPAAAPTLALPASPGAQSFAVATGGAVAPAPVFNGRVGNLAEGGGPKPWHAALPVPEPNTYLLMLAGLGVIGLVARRRRPD